MSLDHFHTAQADRSAGYATALAEMRRGCKSSHWIWYIFPQIEGLGRSPTARAYALPDLAAACAYLGDPLLRARYTEITAVVSEQLAAGASVEALMGGATDAQKLASSLTLFRAAASHLAVDDTSFEALASLCDTALEQTGRHGYPACSFTLHRLAGASDERS